MIVHIVKRSEWEVAVKRGSYVPESLRVDGFIHCSTPQQLIDTANRFYRGQRDLIVLCIDETKLIVELKYEAPAQPHGESAAELFPHLYGELNVDAVERIVELPCEFDGSFRMPDAVGRN